MAKFKKNLENFLKTYNQDINKSVAPAPKSSGFVKPGDIYTFNFSPVKHEYPPPESFRVVLVVEAYGGAGIAKTSRGTPVLCGFILTTIPSSTIAVIMRALHKNRRACSYSNIIQNLTYIFGKSNFRTFGLAKIKNFHSIDINKQALNLSDEINEAADDYNY